MDDSVAPMPTDLAATLESSESLTRRSQASPRTALLSSGASVNQATVSSSAKWRRALDRGSRE